MQREKKDDRRKGEASDKKIIELLKVEHDM